MVLECNDYEKKGYCIKGKGCLLSHGEEPIELDISGYPGLIEAMQVSLAKAAAKSREQENELKRKHSDLLNNIISQQRALINKIEQCSDETEKARLKAALDEMSQKTKDWIEQEGARSKKASNTDTAPK